MLEITIKDQIARITLNRSDCHNALDEVLIEKLTHAFTQAQDARVCILQAKGKHFCAGAHLDWMRRVQNANTQESWEDSMHLATLMKTLDTLPIPTITLVQGGAFGGALGLLAASDIVLASDNAEFCLSEVKLGLVPAIISPYVSRAIGVYCLRHLALTAKKFSATDALYYGLVHDVCPENELAQRGDAWAKELLNSGPHALKNCKSLCQTLDTQCQSKHHQYCVDLITETRASAEAQEGIAAFFEKRRPSWAKQGGQ